MNGINTFGVGDNVANLSWWYPNLDVALDILFTGVPILAGFSKETLTSGSAGIELYPDALNARSYFSIDVDFSGNSLLATSITGGYSREISFEYTSLVAFTAYVYNSISFEYAGTILPKVIGDGLLFSYEVNNSPIKEVTHGNIKPFNNNKITYDVKANKIEFNGIGELSVIFDPRTKH